MVLLHPEVLLQLCYLPSDSLLDGIFFATLPEGLTWIKDYAGIQTDLFETFLQGVNRALNGR